MLRDVKSLVGYAIRASDGDLGRVDEFYFDDQTWTIRYIVVETGSWLSGRKVLLSPTALEEPDWESLTFGAKLTMEQVRNSPDINTAKPISRQYEVDLSVYYAWPMYWGSGPGAGGAYGTAPFGPLMYGKAGDGNDAPAPADSADPHLRSTRAVAGYHVEATDGGIGHVEDYIIDDESWTVRFLVVDTRNWLFGRRVLVPPHRVTRVEWSEAKVVVDLSREAIRTSPDYDPREAVSADRAGKLHDYYGRPCESPAAAPSPPGGSPARPTQVLDWDGQHVGTFERSVDSPDGEMLLIAREGRLGGGTIVVSAREAGKPEGVWNLPYSELAISEAPPYSPNVDLHAYVEFWERVGARDLNMTMDQYLPTGSGPVYSDVEVPDDRLQEAVTAALHEAAGAGVNTHLVTVSVRQGTVLLEGFQNDTPGRLAAAKAATSVPGVKEIINMLVIRAL